MEPAPAEEIILEEAITAFHQATGLPLTITALGTSNPIYDGMAALRLDGNIKFIAEVKKTLPGNIGAIIQRLQCKPDPEHRILVAEYITAQKAEQLKQAKIQFLDTVGNAYIHQPPLFIYIRGNKKEKVVNTTRPGKAFQPSGLKVVLALLIEEELVNAPYRTIAQRAGVALGATGAVLEDLAQQGFLNTAKTKNKKILNAEDLVHKWAEAFPALQRKTHIGTFTTDMPIPQDTIDLAAFDGCWGGEVAAAHYTNYLTPTGATIFVPKAKMAEVMRATRLRKVKHGNTQK